MPPPLHRPRRRLAARPHRRSLAWRLTSSRPLMINVLVSSAFLLIGAYAATDQSQSSGSPSSCRSLPPWCSAAGRSGLIWRGRKDPDLRTPGLLLERLRAPLRHRHASRLTSLDRAFSSAARGGRGRAASGHGAALRAAARLHRDLPRRDAEVLGASLPRGLRRPGRDQCFVLPGGPARAGAGAARHG